MGKFILVDAMAGDALGQRWPGEPHEPDACRIDFGPPGGSVQIAIQTADGIWSVSSCVSKARM